MEFLQSLLPLSPNTHSTSHFFQSLPRFLTRLTLSLKWLVLKKIIVVFLIRIALSLSVYFCWSSYHCIFSSKRKACLYLNLLLYSGRTVPWSQPWCSLFSHFCFFLCISVKFGEGSFVNLHLSHHDSQKSLDFAPNWGWGRGWWAETVGVGEIQRRLNATPEQQNLPECQHLWGKWLWMRDSTRNEEPAGEGGLVQSSWSQHFTNCGEVVGVPAAEL